MADASSVFTASVRGKRDLIKERLTIGGFVDAAALVRAEVVAAKSGQPLEQVLNQLGSLPDDDLVAVYAETVPCDVWEPQKSPPGVVLQELGVSADFLRRARLLPISKSDRRLVCAACDPLDDEAFAGLQFATGCDLSILAARPAEWRREFDRLHALPSGAGAIVADQRRLDRELELIGDRAVEGGGARLVADTFEVAMALGASDIHFEPTRNALRVRLRVDGVLQDHATVSADLAAPAVSRVKVIANLNLGERRLPQDGRTTFVVQGKQVDVRVATSPTVFGEGAVLRILDRTAVPLELGSLGLSEQITDVLRTAAKAAHGLFLVTGPTGSGKTTTLYALLQSFVGSGKKVLSVEDPVEYHFEHVAQTQVAPHIGLTFATALRSFLRQDPDVILVGEIRDPETAAVAVQAAMTGHFVLASVHANDALGVVPRLRDMGVEPYQLVAGFRGAVAQRLVRKICDRCGTDRAPTEVERLFLSDLGVETPEVIRGGTGCAYCKGTGFRGRLPIGEAFKADEELLRAIADESSALEMGRIAAAGGWRSMTSDGLSKALAGLTTIPEVIGAVHG